MDMINTWLDDFANWGKIFGGAAKALKNDGAFSEAFTYLKPMN